MNIDSPTPEAQCNEYAALLPLLNTGELNTDEAASLRTHLAGCQWCQQQAREYTLVDAAVRRYMNRLSTPAPALSLEEVRGSIEFHTPMPVPAPSAMLERRPSRVRRFAGWLALVAAVLVSALVTVALFAPHSNPAGSKPSIAITKFEEPISMGPLLGITAGPDGNLWFTENDNNQIVRVTTTGDFTLVATLKTGSFPYEITAGPDGNLWFTENSNRIGRITLDGHVTEFDVPNANPGGITVGPDDALWFTEIYGNKIGRITLDGHVTEFVIPTAGSAPEKIVSGPDGNLWFTEAHSNKIGRITPGGLITEFEVPTPQSQPIGITAGPDGNLWFTESNGSRIGRISPKGYITEFIVSTSPNRFLQDITAGPDGALWFTDQEGSIGRITLDGHIDIFSLSKQTQPFEITSGPDHNLWFTTIYFQIGRITLRL
jgi:streptogramin lyase